MHFEKFHKKKLFSFNKYLKFDKITASDKICRKIFKNAYKTALFSKSIISKMVRDMRFALEQTLFVFV